MRLRTLRRHLPKLVVLLTVLLVIASGAALADEDHSNGTATPASKTTTGHSDGGDHHAAGTDSRDGTDASGDHHTDDGHHSRTETPGVTHSNGDDGHHPGESNDDRHDGASGGGHHTENPLTWATGIIGLIAVAALPTAPAYWVGKRRDHLSDLESVHIAVIGLSLVSAAVHIYLYLQHSEVQMLLAGLGFIGATVLFFLGVNRRLLYAVGIPYVATQFVLWWKAGMPHLQTYGGIDKVAQLLLIGILVYLLWAGERSAGTS
ncbi:hypothetical protein [Halegenticoccus soli]|uniref:hypothetical protein n=1 Tax=Halegenticoccus soli TaxID=1985678 RepID=UPI00117BB743|nr:hypothetical protein [Halegenticoccus soli]